MKKIIAFIFTISIVALACAQSYNKTIEQYREEYKKSFMTDERSPLKKEDVQHMRFFKPDVKYKVNAEFVKTQTAYPFDMSTLDGQKRKYIEYGILVFDLLGKKYTLRLYQNLSNMSPEYQDYLFLPFTDLTNEKETYGGGRYLDFRIKDIQNNALILDFNKTYNPYCAYSKEYSCPKPPEENNLKVEIKAGEKKFAKEIH